MFFVCTTVCVPTLDRFVAKSSAETFTIELNNTCQHRKKNRCQAFAVLCGLDFSFCFVLEESVISPGKVFANAHLAPSKSLLV